VSAIKWKNGHPEIDSVIFTAKHGGRDITITHDECRGTTYLDIEDCDPKRDGTAGSPIIRSSKVQFDTSVGGDIDVTLAQYCAQVLCDEQDEFDEREK
jgi:hypothetical protein